MAEDNQRRRTNELNGYRRRLQLNFVEYMQGMLKLSLRKSKSRCGTMP